MKTSFLFDDMTLNIDFDTGIVTGDERAVKECCDWLNDIIKKGSVPYRLMPSTIDYPIKNPFKNPKEFVAIGTANLWSWLDDDFAQPYWDDIYYELCPGELRPEEYAKLSPEEKELHDSLEILY